MCVCSQDREEVEVVEGSKEKDRLKEAGKEKY